MTIRIGFAQQIALTIGTSLMASGILVGALVPSEHADETGSQTQTLIVKRR